MSQKLILLDDAIKQFGVSKDRLNELREAGSVRAYRDGTSWKFRCDDLEKVLGEAGPASDLSLDTAEEPSDPSDSILVSDSEVGPEGTRPPSTVIGKPDGDSGDGGSDLDLTLEIEPSDVKLDESHSDVLAGGSGSHILGDPGVTPPHSGKFEDLDEIDIDLETESSKSLPKSKPGGPESELDLVASAILDRGKGGKDIELAVDDDDELVLGESSKSDITQAASDSGINIIEPSDSGVELDEIPIELGGSSGGPLDMEVQEQLQLEEVPEADLKAEDDFLLTPLGGAEGDSSSSQVIALDEAADLEEEAPVLAPVAETVLLEEQPAPAAGETPIATPSMVDDATFSGANVGTLILCILVLLPCGLMMLDLMRNIWTWGESFSYNSGLIEALNFFD